MKTRNFTPDELLSATYIATRLIRENHPGITEADIDIAISRAFVAGASTEQWETSVRMLLALQAVEDEEARHASQRRAPRRFASKDAASRGYLSRLRKAAPARVRYALSPACS